MIKAFILVSSILFTTGCSTKTLHPAMKLTLVDKTTKKAITNAINTKGITLNQKSQIILEKVVRKEVISPSGVHYISSVLAVSAKGYTPQWCLCQRLNTSNRECSERVLELRPQKKSQKDMTEKMLKVWLKSKEKEIIAFKKIYKIPYKTTKIPIFCLEDPLFIKK